MGYIVCWWRSDGAYRRDLACVQCGALLVRTGSGYLACPAGHGKLLEEIGDAEKSPSWRDMPDVLNCLYCDGPSEGDYCCEDCERMHAHWEHPSLTARERNQ